MSSSPQSVREKLSAERSALLTYWSLSPQVTYGGWHIIEANFPTIEQSLWDTKGRFPHPSQTLQSSYKPHVPHQSFTWEEACLRSSFLSPAASFLQTQDLLSANSILSRGGRHCHLRRPEDMHLPALNRAFSPAWPCLKQFSLGWPPIAGHRLWWNTSTASQPPNHNIWGPDAALRAGSEGFLPVKWSNAHRAQNQDHDLITLMFWSTGLRKCDDVNYVLIYLIPVLVKCKHLPSPPFPRGYELLGAWHGVEQEGEGPDQGHPDLDSLPSYCDFG